MRQARILCYRSVFEVSACAAALGCGCAAVLVEVLADEVVLELLAPGAAEVVKKRQRFSCIKSIFTW